MLTANYDAIDGKQDIIETSVNVRDSFMPQCAGFAKSEYNTSVKACTRVAQVASSKYR